MTMKLLACMQVALGTLAAFICGVLAINKQPVQDSNLLTSSPNHTLEAILVIAGLVILGLALVLFLKKTRFAILQITGDLGLVITASVLYNNAVDSAYAYEPGIYWMVFVAFIAALLVVYTGIFQIFKGKAATAGN